MCVAVVGDRAGLFGLGTSGEGCDAEDLSLPGVQGKLVEALLATGSPVVLHVVSDRPYALGAPTPTVRRPSSRPSSPVRRAAPHWPACCPGGPPLRANCPSRSRVRRSASPAPTSTPRSGGRQSRPPPAYPFGHGLSYTTFVYDGFELSAQEIRTDGEVEISCLVRTTGGAPGFEVVQLYTASPIAQLSCSVTQLTGYARVRLTPNEQRRVSFRLHTDRLAYTGPDLKRSAKPVVIMASLDWP